MFAEILDSKFFSDFPTFTSYKREVRVKNSVIDFSIQNNNETVGFIEVKSVHLHNPSKFDQAFFPDAPTPRGSRQLDDLIQLKKKYFIAVVYIIQQENFSSLYLGEEIHSEYVKKIKKLYDLGGQIRAITCKVNESGIFKDKEIDVVNIE